MKYLLFLSGLLLISCQPNKPKSYTDVGQITSMPKFNGDLQKYFHDSLRYPETEKRAGISGTVYVSFTIEKDGAVDNVKIVRGVPSAPEFDKEAIRLISAMPKWITDTGQTVGVQYNVPIHFQLQ